MPRAQSTRKRRSNGSCLFWFALLRFLDCDALLLYHAVVAWDLYSSSALVSVEFRSGFLLEVGPNRRLHAERPPGFQSMSPPMKACFPVSISNRTQPKAQTSARLSTTLPLACSGLV